MTFSQGNSHGKRRIAAAVAGLAAAALILTGCSSGGATQGGGETPATPEGPIAMTVSRGQVNIEGAILAQEQGFFKDAGLDVTMTVGQGAAAQNSAAISGEFQIGLTDGIAATRAIAEGMPIVIVAGAAHADPNFKGETSDGLLVAPGSPIKSWADLGGKKIGIPDLGGIPQVASVTALQANGVDPKSVEFVSLPLPALPEAAAKGDVDAIFVFSVFYLGAKDKGFVPIGTGVKEYLPNAPQSVWIASRDYAEKNPEAIKRFREAMDKANAFADANPDAVRKIYHENSQLPGEFIDNRMVIIPLSVDIPADGWDVLLKALKKMGDVPESFTQKDVMWEGAL